MLLYNILMLKIVCVPNAILTSSVKPVKKIDEKIKDLVNKMEETLTAQDNPPGVGLAGPQVGVNLAIFIIKPTPKSSTKVFINPKIIKIAKHQPPDTKHKDIKLEGCLSIPHIWGPVNRASRVLLEYQDLTSSTSGVERRWFQGFEAIIIQHEMDHLSGVLFTQRSIEQNLPLYEEKNGELEKMDY